MVCKEFRFEAAHSLPNHDGKCRGLHGHSYRFQVECSGYVSDFAGAPDEGMVVDFGRLSAYWKKLEPGIDHRFLNDVIQVEFHPTTAENIARYLLTLFRAEFEDTEVCHVDVVRVCETATAWAAAR